MIGHLYRLWPRPGMLIRLSLLATILAVLQGLLLGSLVPILRALLQSEPDFAAATPWLIAVGCGFVVFGTLKVFTYPVAFAASMDLTAQLRHRLMEHVTTLPLGWFTSYGKARLGRTVTHAVGAVAAIAATMGPQAITAVVVPATITGVTFAVDWRLALAFLITMPIAFLAIRRNARVGKAIEIELDAAGTEIAGRAIEFGQAQSVLRATGQGVTGTARMRAALDEHRHVYRKGMRRALIPKLNYTGIVMMGFAAVLLIGVHFLLGGTLSVPDAIVMFVLASRYLEPLSTLSGLMSVLHAMDNNITRVEDVLNTPALPRSATPVRRVESAGIEFRDVSYSYDQDSAPALSAVSFRCAPGTTTALVGPSGSGKTTVTRLIARFFDADTGSICVGGVDVREYDHPALLNEIAIVFQDVYLFDTTIEENLRIARPGATQEELEQAARAARLDEVVERLPMGWQTRVGEGGAQLSGGERQRVSIARAFLKQARIVLIDEAASALDPENEGAISQAIADLARDTERTVIVIAHRPATLATADQVVALDGGRVTEVGPVDVLYRTGGMFTRLYDQYDHARSWHITTG